jgi:hypothetical protein
MLDSLKPKPKLVLSRLRGLFAGRSLSPHVSHVMENKFRLAAVIVLPLLLFAFIPLSMAAEGILPNEPDEGETVSVMAFVEGYDAIVAELAAKEAEDDPAQPAETAPQPSEPQIFFSLDRDDGQYFFDTDQELEITTSRPAKIYYTLNGSTPSEEKGTLYTEPIPLPSGDNVKVYSFSVIAYFDDGTVSDVYYRSYFIGRNAFEKYDTLVFSLITDSKNLNSRELGILHPNNIWQRGREWERDVNVSCYTQSGRLLFSQNAGMRLFGAYSRSFAQKSLRIIARYDYDAYNRFEYEFFDDLYSYSGTKIGSFKQLVLRNSGNDFGVAFMRDPVVHILMAQQGFPFTESVRPSLVYINGKVYGFLWIHEPYKAEYFKERYRDYDGQGAFVVLDGPERSKSSFDTEYRHLKPLSDYRKMYNYHREDLTDDKKYAELCRLLDVESYLQLYAAFAYVDNGDWPHNNNRAFKYFAAEGEDFSDVYGMDGKWYFLPHDTDFAFLSDVNANTLERNLNRAEVQYSPLFAALMERDDCRWTFVTYILDMINGAFSPKNASRVVEDIIDGIRGSIHIMHAESRYQPPNSDNASFERRAPRIINYLKQRSSIMIEYMQKKYNLGPFYRLFVSFPDGGAAYVNSLYVSEDFTGSYYENYATVLRPVVPPGKEFSCWTVNDKVYETPELVIDASFVRQAKVKVELHLSDPDVPALSVYEVSYRGDGDYVILVNNTSQTVSTLGCMLSDDPAEPEKYMMPVMYIEPGDAVKIHCGNRTSVQLLHSMATDFALRDGETLVLSRKDPKTREIKTLDSIRLPRINYGNVYRRNLVSGVFFEVLPETEGTGGLETNRLSRLPRPLTAQQR